MYRFNFLLLLALIMPILLEGNIACFDASKAAQTQCDTDHCYWLACNGESRIKNDSGCGKCSDIGFIEGGNMRGCNCKQCEYNMCNLGKGLTFGHISTTKQPTQEEARCYTKDVNGRPKLSKKCQLSNEGSCHTLECNVDGETVFTRGCGKCLKPEQYESGCKCTECTGNLCNYEPPYERLVNQCSVGDDQNGYENITCKPGGINKYCHNIECKNGTRISGCGRCPEIGICYYAADKTKCPPKNEDCQCNMCYNKELCNDGIRNRLRKIDQRRKLVSEEKWSVEDFPADQFSGNFRNGSSPFFFMMLAFISGVSFCLSGNEAIGVDRRRHLMRNKRKKAA